MITEHQHFGVNVYSKKYFLFKLNTAYAALTTFVNAVTAKQSQAGPLIQRRGGIRDGRRNAPYPPPSALRRWRSLTIISP